jgi:Viral BACON domain
MQQSNVDPENLIGPRAPQGANLIGPRVPQNPLDFGTVQKGSSKTLDETLTNPNNATLIWNVSVTYLPAGVQWLSSNLLSGTIPPLSQQALSVTANTSTLAPGTYDATLTFSGNFSPNVQASVTLNVQ